MARISDLWKGVFGGASLREALQAVALGNELYAQLVKLSDHLAKATSGSLAEFGDRTLRALKPWPNAQRMLDELASSRAEPSRSDAGEANPVRVMTMRNSKGLEAETVFVVGLEEGAFPSGEHGSGQFEEDARLFYVSMTRAKKSLHIFHARKRSGDRTYNPQSFSMKPSPFLEGLPEQHCDKKYHRSGTTK